MKYFLLFFVFILSPKQINAQVIPLYEDYFVDEQDNLHKGVAHIYEQVINYKLVNGKYVVSQKLKVTQAFSFFSHYFFDGSGKKYNYEILPNLSNEEKQTFRISGGDLIVLMNNKDMWYYTNFNKNLKMHNNIIKFSNISKSRWLND